VQRSIAPGGDGRSTGVKFRLLFLMLLAMPLAHAVETAPAQPNLFQAIGNLLKPSASAALPPTTEVAAPARSLAATAAERPRLALVVGNADYKSGPLANPVNDAKAMAKRLRELNFDVVLRENLKTREIGGVYREFRSKIVPGGVALVFEGKRGQARASLDLFENIAGYTWLVANVSGESP